MVQTKEDRKRQLQQMPREAIVTAWQKAMSSNGSGSTVSVPLLIEQILAREYPPDGEKR
jgi:hypothetical protein